MRIVLVQLIWNLLTKFVPRRRRKLQEFDSTELIRQIGRRNGRD